MESWSSGRRRDSGIRHVKPLLLALAVAVCTVAAPRISIAQAVSASDREALVRLRVDRGGRAEEVDALIRQADEASAKGVPARPLVNKIREGLSKGVDPKRIELVVRQMSAHLETADQVLRETEPRLGAPEREAAVVLLADALGGGVTADDVRQLHRETRPSGSAASADWLASAAKGLSLITQAKLPVPEGSAVIAEAVRQGYRPYEILDLGRDVKRREHEYQSGRATLRALRDAIARGDRPEQLFRDSRTDVVERPAATRPETVVDRPQRPERPTSTERPEVPERPVRPERAR
jgi:hypothetical protein